jgi:hypothetical protein
MDQAINFSVEQMALVRAEAAKLGLGENPDLTNGVIPTEFWQLL